MLWRPPLLADKGQRPTLLCSSPMLAPPHRHAADIEVDLLDSSLLEPSLFPYPGPYPKMIFFFDEVQRFGRLMERDVTRAAW